MGPQSAAHTIVWPDISFAMRLLQTDVFSVAHGLSVAYRVWHLQCFTSHYAELIELLAYRIC